MVKIVKKKKKLRIEGLISLLFVVSIIGYFVAITVLRSHNVILSQEDTKLENEVSTLKNDVDNLELDVKRLGNRDRILDIAAKHGLKVNQSQIVSVKTKDE